MEREETPDHEVEALEPKECLYCGREWDSKSASEQVECELGMINRKDEETHKQKKWYQKLAMCEMKQLSNQLKLVGILIVQIKQSSKKYKI